MSLPKFFNITTTNCTNYFGNYLLIHEPLPLKGVLAVQSKPFQPNVKKGDTLAFSLRANPVEQLKQTRTETEAEQHAQQRKDRGLTEKSTAKRVHHDVVMHFKKSLSDTERENYSQAELEQKAGERWLQARSEKNGFRLLGVTVQGYQQHTFKKRQIKLSTLDFEGILEVTDPDLFIQQALYKGIGRSKAFGCGLLLIKRA
ncbi:MAG: type I-E CRISPR-associated protein Cas6/Cse3/CasE [Methylococcales bacterium]|nr:type I-E CRISPR-associated protein Cas6/Cse3/CasE [Methylococcales bacterium]